jgi:hypothetical protein
MLSWILAAATLGPLAVQAPPAEVTPIEELGAADGSTHVEILAVTRDFGHDGVDVALDAWMPTREGHDAPPRRIDDVRIWWTDHIDRYPFSERTRRRLSIEYQRLGPARWRIEVAGRGRQRGFVFDVRLHEGRPAAFADVVLPDGREVHDCRAQAATLYAQRVFGLVVGLREMVVTCVAPDGAVHRAEIRA